MTTVAPKGDCLVARAVPLGVEVAEHLSGLLNKLTVEENEAHQREINKYEAENGVTPADFVTLQSIRSSALARKTNTTSKFSRNGSALFADLINKDAKRDGANSKLKDGKKTDKDSSEKEEDDEPKDGDLLSRGPVRNVRPGPIHHPYNYAHIPYGTAAQTAVTDISVFAGYGNGYECGSSWSFSPDTTIGSISASTTPDTVLSSDGYGSASPSQNSPKISQQNIAQVLTPDDNELPESLQDFILQYSNQYTKENARARPPSTDSGVSSPMSARSAPRASPHVPLGTCSGPTTPSFLQTRLSPRSNDKTTAKQKLHAIISETDLASGFHWACTTSSTALSTRDADGDTPLHIVVAHLDLGKIYALCETLRKMKTEEENVFSQTNKFGETPLYVAVLQRNIEVIEYLLELGASPNTQSCRGDRETALQYAASRGLTEITEILCTHREIRLDDVNTKGQTALLAAVKNHGMLEEQTEKKIDNKKVIELLLRIGADPCVAENTTGKTIVHYAVDKMDVEMLDLLKLHVPDDTFTELANMSNFDGYTAVDLLCNNLTQSDSTHDSVRQNLYIRLLASGAVGNKSRN